MERRVLPSPFGGVEIVTEGGKLREVNFTSAKPTMRHARDPIGRELERYFRGERTNLAGIPLDLHESTEFERRVYEATRHIPFGKVATYGQIAMAIGKPKAQRAVGNALGKNPIGIVVPCHRVVASNGLGGYSGGLEYKKKLLRHEGVLK